MAGEIRMDQERSRGRVRGRDVRSRSRRGTSVLTALAGVLAIGLLVFASVSGVRAALTPTARYQSHMEMREIGVALVENGNDVPNGGTLLADIPGEGRQLQPGAAYREELAVRNTGDIDEYVCLRVWRYWVKDGKKQTQLDPSLIRLTMPEDTGWICAGTGENGEQTVFYYTKPLKSESDSAAAAADKVTLPAVTQLTVDGKVAQMVDQASEKDPQTGRVTVTWTYVFDGAEIALEAEADAVQTHNAKDAMKSAWGIDASFDGTTLTQVK